MEPVRLQKDGVCLRCKDATAEVVSRKEHFCSPCFIRFVRGKQRKQMHHDSYKVKYGAVLERLGTTKVLLTISGGVSSVVLLDVLASLLQEQRVAHKGKQGFELVILYIDDPTEPTDKKVTDMVPLLLERFEPLDATFKVVSPDTFLLDGATFSNIAIANDFAALAAPLRDDQSYTVSDILARCTNKSSAEDLAGVIYAEVVRRAAVSEGCHTIVYGHSMTRIASEIISLTVKGRGAMVYRAVADRTEEVDGHTLQVLYPMRDVLQAEMAAYAKVADLEQYIVQPTRPKSKITRNLTIRDLTTNYFAMLDSTGYASTASTVVKTGEKLGAPKEPVVAHCEVCGTDIFHDPRGWLNTITVNEAASIGVDESSTIVNTSKDTKTDGMSDGKPVYICYGCTVSLRGSDDFVWPLHSEAKEVEDVLEEFVLTDEE